MESRIGNSTVHPVFILVQPNLSTEIKNHRRNWSKCSKVTIFGTMLPPFEHGKIVIEYGRKDVVNCVEML